MLWPNDDNGLSLERHLYEGTEPTILYTGRPRPCQPTLDALIGILYKDVHAFAVWIHEDHDDLLQNYDEEETDDIENNSNSEMEDNEQVEEESRVASLANRMTVMMRSLAGSLYMIDQELAQRKS